MKKILFILCISMCLPFFSCSNESLDDETLTRMEEENKSIINSILENLKYWGWDQENKYEKTDLYGKWELQEDESTYEVYEDGVLTGTYKYKADFRDYRTLVLDKKMKRFHTGDEQWEWIYASNIVESFKKYNNVDEPSWGIPFEVVELTPETLTIKVEYFETVYYGGSNISHFYDRKGNFKLEVQTYKRIK